MYDSSRLAFMCSFLDCLARLFYDFGSSGVKICVHGLGIILISLKAKKGMSLGHHSCLLREADKFVWFELFHVYFGGFVGLSG